MEKRSSETISVGARRKPSSLTSTTAVDTHQCQRKYVLTCKRKQLVSSIHSWGVVEFRVRWSTRPHPFWTMTPTMFCVTIEHKNSCNTFSQYIVKIPILGSLDMSGYFHQKW